MSETAEGERWLSSAELSARLGISERTIRDWRRDGDGPRGWAEFGPRLFRIPEAAVVAWEKDCQASFETERLRWAGQVAS